MKYQKLLFFGLIAAILVVGVCLIFLAGFKLLPKEPAREISFEMPAVAEEEPEKKFGYPAPDFELPDLKGNKIKLSDCRGKAAVLNFWTTWNPASQDQLKIFDSYYPEIKDSKDVIFFAVNSQEDKSLVLNFTNRGGYEIPVLLDEKGEAGELYKINMLPATYFINREGRVAEMYVGILKTEEIREKTAKLFIE